MNKETKDYKKLYKELKRTLDYTIVELEKKLARTDFDYYEESMNARSISNWLKEKLKRNLNGLLLEEPNGTCKACNNKGMLHQNCILR